MKSAETYITPVDSISVDVDSAETYITLKDVELSTPAIDKCRAWIAYEKTHVKELAEYTRLKKKYGR
jgi:hypothetical protein